MASAASGESTVIPLPSIFCRKSIINSCPAFSSGAISSIISAIRASFVKGGMSSCPAEGVSDASPQPAMQRHSPAASIQSFCFIFSPSFPLLLLFFHILFIIIALFRQNEQFQSKKTVKTVETEPSQAKSHPNRLFSFSLFSAIIKFIEYIKTAKPNNPSAAFSAAESKVWGQALLKGLAGCGTASRSFASAIQRSLYHETAKTIELRPPRGG